MQIKDDILEVKGGVWSLDGSEEILQSLTSNLEEPSTTTESSEPPAKAPKSSITYCGVVPLPGHEGAMNSAHKLGVSLAQMLLDEGAERILKAAKAQNAANAPNIPPNKTQEPRQSNGEAKESISGSAS